MNNAWRGFEESYGVAVEMWRFTFPWANKSVKNHNVMCLSEEILMYVWRISCSNAGWNFSFMRHTSGSPLFQSLLAVLSKFPKPSPFPGSISVFQQVGLDGGRSEIICSICLTFSSNFSIQVFSLAVSSFVFSKAFQSCRNHLGP